MSWRKIGLKREEAEGKVLACAWHGCIIMCVSAECAGRSDMKKTVYKNCTMIDIAADGCLRAGTDIFTDGDRIADIRPTGGSTDGYEVYDATGLFAMPGLVNAHAHLFGTGTPSKVISGGGSQKLVLKLVATPLGKVVLKMLVRSACRQELNSGVTTLRGMGDFRGSDIAVRDEIRKGKGGAAGLQLLVSGPALTAPGGHGDGTFALTGSTPEEFAALVAENAADGADIIKICITGGVTDAKKKGEPGEVKMTAEQVRAACEKAHALGKRVAAHVQSKEGIEIAAACGVDTVEHGAHMSEEAASALKARGGAVVATYTPAYPYYKLPPSVTKLDDVRVFNSGVVLEGMTACVKDAYAHGVTVAMGTDASCPFSTQYGMWREVIYFARLGGFGMKKALYAATMGGAEALGLAHTTGSLEKGKRADILLLAQDPVKEPRTLSAPVAVVAGGRLIAKPKVKRNKNTERILDGLMEEF